MDMVVGMRVLVESEKAWVSKDHEDEALEG